MRTYDQARNDTGQDSLTLAVRPLHQDDRPDLIFCYQNRPVLVVELTRHAYTGDNGLQRFARFAAAAEQGVPFINFGPLKRVRDDELDDLTRVASKRSVTSDLLQGMDQLSRYFDIPQVFVEWKTDKRGLPAKLPVRCSTPEVEELYGGLLDVVSVLLFQAPLNSAGRPLDDPCVRAYQERTHELASKVNTRVSDVRLKLEPKVVAELIANPRSATELLTKSKYFSKGKPDKLLALFALSIADIKMIQFPDGTLRAVDAPGLRTIIRKIFATKKFSGPALVYYTGYKWRSDPHCGVLVNLDYRLCRKLGERMPADRSTGLVVLYPRVSLNPAGAGRERLNAISSTNAGGLRELFGNRYGTDAPSKMAATLRAKNLFSVWNNSSKQARLFRRYADVVVLNDGLVLGEGLAGLF